MIGILERTAREEPASMRERSAAELLARRQARRNFLDFMRYCWWMSTPLIVGRHTRAIADRLTKAIDDFEAGESTFLNIEVPFRHGKSDMVSRAFPAFFLGRMAELQPDVIMSGYGADLVESFSDNAKTIIRSDAYHRLFPAVQVSPRKASAKSWAIDGSSGRVKAAGLGGAITGRGGHLITIDDYCKNREEAESETYRARVWDSFTNDIMTRRAPVCIAIICATRWNVDDLAGRINKRMGQDPDFPRFETLKFPAQSEKYPAKYLFPERFSPSWYSSQRATLGEYSAAALLDCEPVIKGGKLLKVDRVQIHDSLKDFQDCPYVRCWDLASTEKQTQKDDPDFTAGGLIGLTQDAGGVPHLWVKDMVAGQWGTTERDRRIRATAALDGPGVRIGVEVVAGYKDAWAILHDALLGKHVVVKVQASADKVVRAGPLEPIFEAGHVHILRAHWNALFFSQCSSFPSTGAHDDVVDTLSGGYAMHQRNQASEVNMKGFGR